MTTPPITRTWTLRSYEVVFPAGTLRTTIVRTVDGDTITRHVDLSQPPGDAWTDADACAAIAAALGAGHAVVVPEAAEVALPSPANAVAVPAVEVAP
jgi:hypothetical protein